LIGAQYASLADFVDEGQIIGRDLFTLSVSNVPTTGGLTITNTFDAMRRVVEMDSSGQRISYASWDSQGRPLTGTFTLSTSFPCTGTVGFNYDDSAHRHTNVESQWNWLVRRWKRGRVDL
jgi:hypothetical protein